MKPESKRETLIKTLRRTASDFELVSQKLFQISNQMDEIKRYNPQNTLFSLVETSEMATVILRNLTARTISEETPPYYSESVNAMGISVREEHDWIKITVPAILPKRNMRDNQAFLVTPLRQSIRRFLHENPMERFGECAICIVHKYDEALGTLRVRDYDNIETKRYLDVIEAHLLTNDSGLLCTVLQCTEIADRDATEFYLMPPKTLPKWVEKQLKSNT